MNQQVIDSFLDELQAIDKHAQGPWAGLGKALSGAFNGAKKGFGTVKGHLLNEGPTNWQGVKAGLHEMAPAAAITGAGGLGLYGAGHATGLLGRSNG